MDKHCECIVPVTIQGSIICGECGGVIVKPIKDEKRCQEEDLTTNNII